jgi:hypothetical protein
VSGEFGYASTQEVSEHIRNNWYTYYTHVEGEPDVLVHAVGVGQDSRLRSEANRASRNYLLNLPDC